MALTNKLRKIVDQPVWEWLRYSPFSSAGTNCMVTVPAADTGSWQHRYMYGLNSTAFWRYDTYSDAWSYLGGMIPNSPVSTITGTWKTDDGHSGRFISATSGSVYATGSFINESAVIGLKIKVATGPGRGDVRTIVNSSKPVNVEYLTVTGYGNTTTTVLYVTDSSKKWIPNQWRGYQCRVYLGTSQQSFVRRILYNNNDTLFFANAEWHAIDPQHAYAHLAGTELAPGTSYASRAVIQMDTIEVDSPWSSNMDYSTRFEIQTGFLHSIQNISTNAFFLHYIYDPLYATFFTGKSITSIIPTYLVDTELQIEGIDASLTPVFTSGSLTSATARSVTDSTKLWKTNQWANYRYVNKTNGYERAIISNNSATLYFRTDLDIIPSAGDLYEVVHDSDKLYMNGGNFSTMVQYSTRNNSWMPSRRLDDGVLNTGYVRFSSSFEMQHPISSITRTGSIATVTTITGHPFVTGDRIFVSGALGADSQYYNGFFTVTSSYALHTSLTSTTQPTTFTYAMSGTPSGNATLNTHTTATVYDTSKNWSTNEYVGKVVEIWSSSPIAPTSQFRKIASNTSNSLTITGSALSAVTSNIWGYNIIDDMAFGASWGLYDNTKYSASYAFTGSTVNTAPFIYISSSYDSIINSIPIGAPISGSGIPANTFYRSHEHSVDGLFISMSISNNASATANNIVFLSDLTTTVGYGTATSGTTTTLVDSTKNWPSNFWAGARLKIIAGTGINQELAITANTATQLTFATATAPDATSVYSILPIQPRNTVSTTSGAGGADIKWVYGRAADITPIESLGKYIYCFQANTSMRFEKYNIATMQYEYPFIMPFSHQAGENLTTGTMYAYDGKGRIYIQPNVSARIIYIDTDYDRSESAGQIPAGHSTARQGRKMWIKKTEDGLDYLYIMRHNDTPWWRQLIFF